MDDNEGGNEFENYEIVQHNEVEIAAALRGVEYSNGHWDTDIAEAVEEMGGTCEIDGRKITVTIDGNTMDFFKQGHVIVSNAEVTTENYREMVQSEIASGIAEEQEGAICYEVSTKSWYVFNGVWREDKLNRAPATIQNRVEEIRRSIRGTDRAQRQKREAMGRNTFVAGVISMMTRDPRMTANIEFFDNDDLLLGCPDGYIDLRTGEVMPPDPLKLITKSIEVMPSDTVDCHKFLEILEQSHKGQEEMIPYLQKLAGLCLSGIMKDEVFHYFSGSGGNGKGVFLDPFVKALGDYAGAAQEDAFTISRSGNKGHDQAIASLRGLRLILLSEPEEGRYWAVDRIKRWTGNEGPIKANFMRQNGFDLTPKGKLIVVANHDINVTTVNEAIRRRLRKMVWPNSPAEKDENLKEYIKEHELGGIIRWAMDGWKIYQKEGLEAPAGIITATNEYIEDQDFIGQFVSDCLIITEEKNTMKVTADLQPVYDEWQRKHDAPILKRGLAKKLKDAGVPSGKSGAIGNILTNAKFSGQGELLRDEAKARMEREEERKGGVSGDQCNSR